MPLYPYTCEECEHSFEALVKSSAKSVACPKCHSVNTTRGLGIPAKPAGGNESLPMSACGDGPPCGRTGCGRIR